MRQHIIFLHVHKKYRQVLILNTAAAHFIFYRNKPRQLSTLVFHFYSHMHHRSQRIIFNLPLKSNYQITLECTKFFNSRANQYVEAERKRAPLLASKVTEKINPNFDLKIPLKNHHCRCVISFTNEVLFSIATSSI